MKKFLFVIFTFCSLYSFGQNDSCSYNNVYIGDTFYKAKNGVVYDTGTISIKLNTFCPTSASLSINLCFGDELWLTAYGTYDSVLCPHCDSLATFYWYFGNGDSSTVNGVDFAKVTYVETDCFDIVVKMTDSLNCGTKHDDYVQVLIADNPIRTVFTLQPICQYDSLPVNVGYGNDAAIRLREIENIKHVTKVNDVKTFIPDGPNCSVLCYEAPVTFTEFPAGKTVESAEDICSVCINFEHSYMGDYRLTLKCPNGQSAILKYGSKCSGSSTSNCDPLVTNSTPTGAYGGGSQYTGIPYGGANDAAWDNFAGNYCDSIYNMYGIGYDYCFSRNSSYTLTSGNNAATTTPISDDYIASTNNMYMMNVTQVFSSVPAPYVQAGQTANVSTFKTKIPSDYDNKINYYLPADDFSSLIGCPLNGNWSIEVCDFWGQDNGWVFNWSLDICGVTRNECEYKIYLDSVVWYADDNLNFNIIDSATAYLSSDTFGVDFPVYLSVYDNFGCKWDTNTTIDVTHTPQPNIGPDTALCPSNFIILNAFDSVYNQNYSYIWSTGETTSDIILQNDCDVLYVVEVRNSKNNIVCATRDSLNFKVLPHPQISFDVPEYPLEGCEPYFVYFNNYTKAVTPNGTYPIGSNIWYFGDSTYSTEYSPTHGFPAGEYTVKYIAKSNDGCIDSMMFPKLINVYQAPQTNFTWDPVTGRVKSPVAFTNRTDGEYNIYRWEYKYDYDFPYSWNTVVDENPLIIWEKPEIYPIRLITFTTQITPSGRVLECRDTTENSILIVNDYLQFPNVVTPNGDGINDLFVIKNLLEGNAFPKNSLYIYNRWGVLVYQVEDISSISDFWDPNKTNSPDGTYFYRFTAKGYTGDTEHHGVIEVLR